MLNGNNSASPTEEIICSIENLIASGLPELTLLSNEFKDHKHQVNRTVSSIVNYMDAAVLYGNEKVRIEKETAELSAITQKLGLDIKQAVKMVWITQEEATHTAGILNQNLCDKTKDIDWKKKFVDDFYGFLIGRRFKVMAKSIEDCFEEGIKQGAWKETKVRCEWGPMLRKRLEDETMPIEAKEKFVKEFLDKQKRKLRS